jgi:hypothetical protein
LPQTILLLCVVMPAWFAAGFADWALHRRARIERNAGVRESVLHIVMLAEIGIPILAVILLEFNAGVLALCLLAFAMHEVTVYLDLRWAAPRRTITPLEQMVHSVQEMLPVAALALLASLYWEASLSLLGVGQREAAFAPVLRADAPPLGYLSVLAATSVLLGACYLEELWRCIRHRRGGAPGRTTTADGPDPSER